MHGPGDPQREAEIKKLLASRKQEHRDRGLELLDKKYRGIIFAALRKWSDRYGPGLTAQDIEDIWSVTVDSVRKKSDDGTFSEKGNLDALLRKIARARAIDLLRRRRTNVDRSCDMSKLPDNPSHLDHAVLEGELLEDLKYFFDTLTEIHQIVMRIEIMLILGSADGNVGLEELTERVNLVYGLSLKKSTVRSRRGRAREKLRKFLEERGYRG